MLLGRTEQCICRGMTDSDVTHRPKEFQRRTVRFFLFILPQTDLDSAFLRRHFHNTLYQMAGTNMPYTIGFRGIFPPCTWQLESSWCFIWRISGPTWEFILLESSVVIDINAYIVQASGYNRWKPNHLTIEPSPRCFTKFAQYKGIRKSQESRGGSIVSCSWHTVSSGWTWTSQPIWLTYSSWVTRCSVRILESHKRLSPHEVKLKFSRRGPLAKNNVASEPLRHGHTSVRLPSDAAFLAMSEQKDSGLQSRCDALSSFDNQAIACPPPLRAVSTASGNHYRRRFIRSCTDTISGSELEPTRVL